MQDALERYKKTVFPLYKKVLMVMGNHEYYDTVWRECPKLINEAMVDVSNFKLLENDIEIIDGIMFIGATFWTNFNNNNPIDKLVIQNGLNDYRYTYLERYEDLDYEKRKSNSPRRITADFIYDKHLESLHYIKHAINVSNLPIVIITHHPATLQALNREHSGNELDAGFASDYDDMIKDNPKIKMWISGHTHMSHDFMIGQTRMISNQCGYYTEKSYKIFQPKIVEI